MSYKIELHPKALADFEASCEWYEERSEGLGARLLTLVSRKLAEIAEHPENYSKRKGNYRDAAVEVFPT